MVFYSRIVRYFYKFKKKKTFLRALNQITITKRNKLLKLKLQAIRRTTNPIDLLCPRSSLENRLAANPLIISVYMPYARFPAASSAPVKVRSIIWYCTSAGLHFFFAVEVTRVPRSSFWFLFLSAQLFIAKFNRHSRDC